MLLVDLEKITKFKATLTDQLKSNLIKVAEEALVVKVNPVSNKKHLRFGATKNDFVSAAPYWWPNPDTDDGLPYIKKDGQVNPLTTDDDYYDRNRLNVMHDTFCKLAVAYFYTNDMRYKDAACEHLYKWFVDPETRMNPSLDYAQQIAGVCNGRDFGIIDTTCLVNVIDCALLLNYEKIDDFKEWAAKYLEWLLTDHNGISESKKDNNHGLWYDAQVIALAAFTGNTEVVKTTAINMKDRIASQVAEDGSLPEELARTRSYMYSHFALRGIYYAHEISAKFGVQILTQEYKKCFDFLMPFVNGTKVWKHTQILNEEPSDAGACMYFGYRIFGDVQFREAANKKYGEMIDNPTMQLRFPV